MNTLSTLLGQKQSQVYLASLKLGPSPVGPIAKLANLPRSSTYLIIDELLEKGILNKIIKNNKTLITPEPPEKLIAFTTQQTAQLEQIKSQLTDIIPELKALNTQNTKQPIVKYYQGINGIKEALEDTFNAKEILVLCSGYDHPIEPKLDQYLIDYYEKTVKMGIKSYEILGTTHDLDPYILKYNSSQNQMKKCEFRKHPLDKGERQAEHGKGILDNISNQPNPLHHIDKLIYNNKLTIISFEYLNATTIEHQPIVEFERAQFFKLWESIPD